MKDRMGKIMKTAALVLLLLTGVSILLYRNTAHAGALTAAITCGTAAYHLCMRLLVGHTLDILLKNQVDYRRRWFRVGKAELKLYQKLKVKKWKNKLPSYDRDLFDKNKHTWEEIAQAMCQAELVHEIIAFFSLLPILAGVWFGAWPVFIITSVLAAALDAAFVILQRFNRPRIVKLIERG